MTRTRKGLIAAALAALIAPAAVVAALSTSASADADGKHRHDLNTYKLEAWHELLSTPGHNSLHEHMECAAGDIALDGMWKVDAHDGDDSTVRATVSRRDVPLKNKWHYELVNEGSGRAQIKTFITCLSTETGQRDGHSHLVEERTPVTVSTPALAGETTLTAACAGRQIPVSPSFALTNGADARLVKSYPSTAGLYGADNIIEWEWVFYGTAVGDIDVTLYCIDRQTSEAGSPLHNHRVDADFLFESQTMTTTGPGHLADYRVFARAHDEGNVGGFDIVTNRPHTYHQGQDAQGQVRGFRFVRPTAGSSDLTLGVWGFDKRTKKNS